MDQIALAGALVAASLIWKPWPREMKRDEEKERNYEESMGILPNNANWILSQIADSIFLELSKIGLAWAV